jgi:hypothetical protein
MKNVFAFFSYNFWYMVLGVTALGVVVVLPYWGAFFCEGLARLCFIGAIVVRVLGIGLGLLSSGVEKQAIAWLLITPFFLLYIILRAAMAALAQGGISWRGSFYPMQELRKQEWVLAGLFRFI